MPTAMWTLRIDVMSAGFLGCEKVLWPFMSGHSLKSAGRQCQLNLSATKVCIFDRNAPFGSLDFCSNSSYKRQGSRCSMQGLVSISSTICVSSVRRRRRRWHFFCWWIPLTGSRVYRRTSSTVKGRFCVRDFVFFILNSLYLGNQNNSRVRAIASCQQRFIHILIWSY